MDNPTNTPPVDNQSPMSPVTDSVSNDKVLGILAYLSILVLIPILSGNKSSFVKFHTNQGLVLFIVWIVGRIVLTFVGLWMLQGLFSLIILALSILGIVNVANGMTKELPVIGAWRILK